MTLSEAKLHGQGTAQRGVDNVPAAEGFVIRLCGSDGNKGEMLHSYSYYS